MNIIVSGASSGIGYELALELDSKGHQVLAIARRSDLLNKLKQASKGIKILSIDLQKDEELEKLNEELRDWDRVDVLINNAGSLVNSPFMDTSIELFRQQMEVNYLSAIRLIKSTYAKLLLSDIKHIVNITSMGGVQGSNKFPGLSAYSSSKGALSILTECLAEEFREEKIKINALALGAVSTKMLSKAFPTYNAPVSPGEMAAYIGEFATEAYKYYNGKVLQVALENP